MEEKNKRDFYFLAQIFFDGDADDFGLVYDNEECPYIYKYDNNIIAFDDCRIHTATNIDSKYKDGFYVVKNNRQIASIEHKEAFDILCFRIEPDRVIKYIEDLKNIRASFKNFSLLYKMDEIEILKNKNLTVDESFINDILKFGTPWDVTIFDDMDGTPAPIQFVHENLTAYIMPKNKGLGR